MIRFIDHPNGSLTVTDGNHCTLFNPAEVAALWGHLAAQHGYVFDPPTSCDGCGAELTDTDVEVGETVCLDCAGIEK